MFSLCQTTLNQQFILIADNKHQSYSKEIRIDIIDTDKDIKIIELLTYFTDIQS